MLGRRIAAPTLPRDYSACSGCSLCFLVCPMWRARRDPRYSPEGIAKALQCGATVTDFAAPLDACSLCGACDPVCPEGIDLPGLIMDLRRQSPPRTSQSAVLADLHASLRLDTSAVSIPPISGPLLLPGPDLRAATALLEKVQALLGIELAADDGADIALALELGVEIPPARLHAFLDSVRGHSVVAADGLLLRQLRRWLPGSQRLGLGAALGTRPTVRSRLRADDLYVIEARAYHADYERMVAYYDRLRADTGCCLSLDLQRIAIPAVARGLTQRIDMAAGDGVQAQWLLQGRKPGRIVVESLADRAAFERVCDLPVVHLAELGEDPEMIKERPHAFG